MQPPETDPSMPPSESISSWLPAGRGEDPQVCTTVARATRRPWSSHAAAVARMSSVATRAGPLIPTPLRFTMPFKDSAAATAGQDMAIEPGPRKAATPAVRNEIPRAVG